MYCEYYKLYNIICEYLKENKIKIYIDNKEIDYKKFIKYNDLDTIKQYPINEISKIYDEITSILDNLNNIAEKKEKEITNYKKTNTNGLDINNFVSTHSYFNKILNEKIILFNNYFEFFNNSHIKQLNTLQKNYKNL